VRWALLAGSLLLVAAFSASELAGLTAITSWAVAPVKKDVAQEARVSPVEGLQPDIAVPQPANREPILLAAAPPANVKGPAPEAAPAAAKMAADADDSRPQQITALRLFEGHTGPVSGVAISLDGKRAVSCSGYPQGDATVRLWDVASGKEVRRLNADRLPVLPAHAELANPSGEVWTVAFSPDGRHVLFGGANGVLGLWSVHDGAVVRRFVGHKGVVHGVAISRDGKLGLSGGADRTVRLWDMGTGKEIQRMMGHTDFVRGVAFSPDGTRALSGSKDHTMRFWDLKKGEQHREPFLGHPDCVVWSMAFLPDGQQAISGDATIRLWDLAKDLPGSRQLRTFDGHTSPIYDVTLSPDGLRILSCSVDRTVRLWDRATGREIATLVGHRNFVQSVAFSPDGRYALSGGGGVPSNPPHQTGNDYALRLWELP
jgi:WD40 repeat protein